MWCRDRRAPAPAGRQDGVALVAVLIATLVLSGFLIVALQFGLQNATAGRKDQDAKIASAAAQAGIEEYLSRLNADPNYYTKQNNDSANPAFGAAGRVIQGTGTAGARYHYEVLSTVNDFLATGVVRLQSTGISRTVSRTLTANLRTKGFLSFIYLSDVEVVDPALTGANSGCADHYYEGRSGLSNCGEIQWTGGDTVKGPLHSNDALQINGAVNFTNSSTETSWPATNGAASNAKTWWGTAAAGSLAGYSPKYGVPIALPDQNTTLATHTTPGVDGLQTGPGCYYTGATKITFTGSTMSVFSPSTTSASTPARCLVVANRGQQQTGLAIPPVIYVNSTTTSCTNGTIGYPASGEAVTTGSADATYWNSAGSNKTTNYRCGRGTAYVSGTAHGQVTIATSDDIVLTGDLKTADNLSGTDVIGLIATNDIWVYHPLNSATDNLLSSANTPTVIQAAILSVSHSFVVQNWADGSPLGTLNVTGAIAQEFRGAVGTSSGGTIATGYYKNYVYDPRLAYLQPPFFLASSSNIWLVSSVTDD